MVQEHEFDAAIYAFYQTAMKLEVDGFTFEEIADAARVVHEGYRTDR